MNNDSNLKLVLNSIDLGILLTGSENKIIFLNDFFKKYLGIYNYEGLKIEDLFEIILEDQVLDSNIICGYPEVQTNGVIFEKEPLILATKDKQNKIVAIKTIKNKQLFEMGITSLVVIKDIEEKAELEKMKIDFSSQTVHILRTPISIIRNNLDSLKKSEGYLKLSEKETKNVNEIEYATGELLNLAQNLITINEIENNRIDIELTQTHIFQILDQAVLELKEVKNKTGNNIVIVKPIYEIPNINVDVLKLASVFKGIIMNSLKHTINGEVLIKISKDPDFLIIDIEDNGEGMPETSQKFIFNKFYHSKKNPLVMEEGLGIGLYYCKKIIEAHNGTIEISSKVGAGTKVRIKLKLQKN